MTIEKFIKWDGEGKVKAFFSVKTSEGILIHKFKILDGSNGLWISSPRSKNKNGEWWDDVTLPDQLKDELEAMALSEYNGSQPSNPDDGPGF